MPADSLSRSNSITTITNKEDTLASRYGSRKISSIRSKRDLEHYAIKKTLGQGSFAKVKLCQHLYNNEKLAVKIIEKKNIKTSKLRTSVKREIRLNKLIHHPHIAKVFEMIETDTAIFIMMEYIEGGELFDYIIGKGHLQEKEARHFFRQLISAMDYLHKSSIVHRDLKPENLLLDKTKTIIKLVDFGLGNTWQHSVQLETFCGSPYYAAPEMISGTPYTGPEVDIWSMGVILFAMVSGTLPFDSTNMRQLYDSILEGHYIIPQSFSGELSRLMSRILRVNPLARSTMDEIANDKWVNHGYLNRPNAFIPHRDPIIHPLKKNLVELSSFGIKESDILAVLRDPEQKSHPLVSLYHLCNEARDWFEKQEFYETYDHDAWIKQKKSIREKLASSKLALVFRKWMNPKRNLFKSTQSLYFKKNQTSALLDSEVTEAYLDEIPPLPKKFHWVHKKSRSDGTQFIKL